LVPVFAAPTNSAADPRPTAYNHGDIVGVRAKKIEKKDPTVKKYKDIDIHPGVVVAGPDSEGKYQVATVSKKHLHDPPQVDAASLHPATDLEGKIKLVASDPIDVGKMKPWKSSVTGETMAPMSSENLRKLKEKMEPHTGWKAPHEIAAASSSKPAGNRAIPGQAHAGVPKNRSPNTGAKNLRKKVPGPRARPHTPVRNKAQHLNVHAGGSKRPAPAGKKAQPPHTRAGNSKRPVVAPQHRGAPGSKTRVAPRPQTAKINNNAKKPVINRNTGRGRKA